jgi:inorganic pyrophosphatase
MNLWHELPVGSDWPEVINVIVEIPKGSRNKYEYDKRLGVIKLNRVLFSSLYYPGDYGLIPRTHYEDGDPLDVLVMINEPTFPGCVLEARPVAFFRMMDKDLPDDKVLAVPASDPLYTEIRDLEDVPPHFLREVAHFFSVYKDLEEIRVKPIGWEPREAAYEHIRHAVELYSREGARLR